MQEIGPIWQSWWAHRKLFGLKFDLYTVKDKYMILLIYGIQKMVQMNLFTKIEKEPQI